MLALLTAAFTVTGLAQSEGDRPPHPGGPGDMFSRLSQALNLSEQQKQQIQPILESKKPQLDVIRNDAQAKVQQVMAGVDAQIRPLLTPEQQAKLDQLKARRQQGEKDGDAHGGPRAEGQKHGGPAEHLQKMKEELGLTADQEADIKQVFEESRPQMQELHENSSLSPEQKREQMRQIMEANRAKIRALLTPEQQAKFDQMKPKREGVPARSK